jgi:hypothetical protein
MPASRNLGLWIAIAALGVNAPRLVQAFLEADGLQLSPAVRPMLMGATGVAAALTLTGGGAWLAHELARSAGERLQGLLLTCWLLVLAGQLVLIPPLLMVEMGSSRLGTVLPESWQRWSWAFVAVLLVELVAAGAMVAQGRRSRWAEERAREAAELERIAAERNALAQQLRRLEVQPRGGSPPLQALQPLQPLQALQPQPLQNPLQGRKKARSKTMTSQSFPCRKGCGWVGGSQKAENAHQRYCKAR